jgi:hypothetical protein
MIKNFATYTQETGGRAILLFLLFGLAIYQFIYAGFPAFAIVCCIPIIIIAAYVAFKYRMAAFWALFFINYFVHFFSKNQWLPSGIPMSLYNEMLEILLLGIAIIDARRTPHFERTANLMLYALIMWCGFCTLEVLNDTCGLGINIGAWYQGARMMAFQILYLFIVFCIYIDSPKILNKYLILWGCLSLFSVFWIWKQQHIGFTSAEYNWLYNGPGRATHIIQGGTLTRYFSTFSDAANCGVCYASTATAFLIFAITCKIKKYRYFFFFISLACVWGMFPTGTRTAIVCLGIGVFSYIFLSKSVKIAVPVSILFGLAFFFIAFTNIGQGNQQIRRMRSAFKGGDASTNVRTINQQTMRKYMKEAPWGIGLGMNYKNVPANNKYALMSNIPPDSDYVFIWLRTGKIGITIFIITMLFMLGGACWITMFKIKSPSLRGIGAGFCCAFISQQLGGYGNQVLMQFPNALLFYGGLSIVYILPFIEKEWVEYEAKEVAKQEEKERLKLEKKKASRV